VFRRVKSKTVYSQANKLLQVCFCDTPDSGAFGFQIAERIRKPAGPYTIYVVVLNIASMMKIARSKLWEFITHDYRLIPIQCDEIRSWHLSNIDRVVQYDVRGDLNALPIRLGIHPSKLVFRS
jgi:hypothetical protein